ncbi:hypothetical protein G6F57_003911 [Rhizopus arrhizus]|uniref:Uncharacterized protein n=1 Tax=Rhizopus oryzae TaxID=64495 RepID=A0A9P7BV34_RHIOR|nr:hypothetical protein G6F30_005200 [Rhizopus arrhizus]KAG0983497.1 hypothetical protein G6F29_005488 [Rhizopus arrhizus]KAG0995500.1 hypothetical protein G6F28_004741 [Rhizopus arrhizus]KAG1009501.1 hypothetical protein G6F27_005531 [Rhizopus arrhizus]KAG1025232.1 hypothetical protein G6F26_005286 [Rhizopus arrhizus]
MTDTIINNEPRTYTEEEVIELLRRVKTAEQAETQKAREDLNNTLLTQLKSLTLTTKEQRSADYTEEQQPKSMNNSPLFKQEKSQQKKLINFWTKPLKAPKDLPFMPGSKGDNMMKMLKSTPVERLNYLQVLNTWKQKSQVVSEKHSVKNLSPCTTKPTTSNEYLEQQPLILQMEEAVTESWNTLGALVTTISLQLRERSESNIQPDNMKPENATTEGDLNEENSTTNIMTQQAEPDDYILENEFNISTHFRQFNLESNKKSKESGFYVDGDLHQILSLSHVLLLKGNEHDESIERLEDDIREAELIGTFLDPILNPIFHDPEKNRLFRWLNAGVEDTESLRPDGNVFELEQRRIKFSTGYVEVKPDKSRSDILKTHEDLLRLVSFCKDTLDKKDVKSMVAVQAVGYYVTIYMFSLEATGLYLLTELYSFNVPKSISELPQFVMHLDEIKKIMVCYQENCVLANDIHKESRKRMSIQQQNTRNILNIQGKNSRLLSSCRPTITLDPILWLPMIHEESSRCLRWRLGWLPGGAPKPCPRHPNNNLSRRHAISCLNTHRRLCMPETTADPISFLLNVLPTRAFVPFSIALSWTCRRSVICSILHELDQLQHYTTIPCKTPHGQKLIEWPRQFN